MSGRQLGTVTDWLQHRGFGFIRPNSGGKSIFVHARDAGGDLRVGQVVEFDVGDGSRGRPKAVQAVVVAERGDDL